MLIFDISILHRAITSKEPLRYVINFNYFTQVMGEELKAWI